MLAGASPILNPPNNRILVIDDNEAIHSDFRKLLAGERREVSASRAAFFEESPSLSIGPAYEVDSAFQGEQGYRMAGEAHAAGRPYAMAFVDMRMPPGWDGLKTLQQIWREQPEMQAVLCTAYSDYTWEQMASKLGQLDRLLILKKPFDVVEVRQLACALTEKWRLSRQARMKIDELELTVSERTSNLARVNRQLETEIDARRQAENHFRLVIEMSPYAVVTVGQDGTIELVNSEMEELFGYTRDELIGAFVESLVPERYRARHVERWSGFLNRSPADLEHLKRDLVGLRKDGSEVPVQIRLKRIASDRGTFALAALMDISERKQMEERLRHDATHDALTTLPNRALFLERLKQAIQRSERRFHYLYSVLFLDLDRFKYVNDSLGHLIGDQLLVAAAQRIESCLRPEDMVARIGGDEFAVLLDDLQGQESPIRVAQRILQAFSQPFEINDERLVTTASIGITYSSTGYYKPEDVLRDADTAMYEAKSDGKGCFRVFDSGMHEQAKSMLVLENDLRRAVEQGEFFCMFQPIVSLTDGRIVAFEALLRWRHPSRGVLRPGDFMDVAENVGLMVPIGRQVLQDAFRQLHCWKRVCERPIAVSVNVSPRQLAEQNLMQQIEEAVESTGIEPADVCIEVTEGAILENTGVVTRRLSVLQDMGFRLQVDDFGTGYASLSYLYKFPFSTLKIDRSFISGRDGDGPSWQIVEAIISLAHKLNMTVIAEGIETEEQYRRLHELGCNCGQGFLLAQPLNEQDARSLLAKSPYLLASATIGLTNVARGEVN